MNILESYLLELSNLKIITFPKEEHDNYLKRLNNNQGIFTTRISKDFNKYKVNDILISDLNNMKLIVTKVETYHNIEDHPYLSYLTKEQVNQISKYKEYDCIWLKEDKEDIKIYHYLYDEKSLSNILRDKKLMSISELLIPSNVKSYAKRAIDKKIPNANKDNTDIENANIYWKYVYNKFYYPILKSPYKNYGIYLTPLDLFQFENNLNLRIKINFKDLPKESLIQLGLNNVKKITSKNIILDVTKNFKDINKVEKIYNESKLKFQKLPQIISFDHINVSKDMIEKR